MRKKVFVISETGLLDYLLKIDSQKIISKNLLEQQFSSEEYDERLLMIVCGYFSSLGLMEDMLLKLSEGEPLGKEEKYFQLSMEKTVQFSTYLSVMVESKEALMKEYGISLLLH
jgi:hypothetical protein